MADIRTDFENLSDGDVITLHPHPYNQLHKRPIVAVFQGGYFYCEGSQREKGADYYLGDVLAYNHGFTDGSNV